jgi:hypothetical protein
MFTVNGYTAANRPYANDKWTPVLDTYNDWMQIGDSRFGTMHSSIAGYPGWGTTTVAHSFKIDTGFVCLGYWNAAFTSCLSCMNTCFSCANSSTCNQLCSEKYANCNFCNSSACTQC